MCRFQVILMLLISFSCSENKHISKIAKSKDITVITNTSFPKFTHQEKNIELRLLFQIGIEDGDDNYILNRPIFLGEDSKSNIYIMDFGDCRVKVYDNMGSYIHSFGREGRGPGEFLTPGKGHISNINNLLVIFDLNNSRYQILNTSGELINAFRTKKYSISRHVHIAPDSTILSLETIDDSGEDKIRVVRYKLNGEILSEFFVHSLSYNEMRQNWSKRGCMAVSSDGFIYLPCIEIDSYAILSYDMNGVLRKKITSESEQYPFSNYEKKRHKKLSKHRKALVGREQPPLPAFRPMIRRFLVDGQDRVWIWSGEYNINEGWRAIDIFDDEGRYLYKYIDNKIWAGAVVVGNRLYNTKQSNVEYPRLEVYQIIDNL